MIRRYTSSSSLRTAAIAIAAAMALPALCMAQGGGGSVYVNPRSGPDDPRIGLKGGLYYSGEAAFGLEHVISTPKPAGFAPDLDSIKAYDAAPATAEGPPGPPAPRAPGSPAPIRAN